MELITQHHLLLTLILDFLVVETVALVLVILQLELAFVTLDTPVLIVGLLLVLYIKNVQVMDNVLAQILVFVILDGVDSIATLQVVILIATIMATV